VSSRPRLTATTNPARAEYEALTVPNVPQVRAINKVGSTWRSGVGAPAGSLGVRTDWYVDTASGDVYEKTGHTTWTLRFDLPPPLASQAEAIAATENTKSMTALRVKEALLSGVWFALSATGAVARTILSKWHEHPSVEDFGAVADYAGIPGSATDNLGPFNAAIAWGRANGRLIHIPAGEYYFSAGLDLTAGDYTQTGFEAKKVSFIGDGTGKTRLWFPSTATVALRYKVSNVGMFELKGFRVTRVGLGLTGYGILLDNCSYFSIEDVYVEGFDHGVFLGDSFSGRLVGVVARNNRMGLGGAFIDGSYLNSLTILGCDFAGNTHWGADLNHVVAMSMNGTSIQGNGWVFTLGALTRAGAVATGITATPHDLVAGDPIYVSGATDPLYNGTYLVGSVPNPTTFTYTMAGTPAANAVGSPTIELRRGGGLRLSNGSAAVIDGGCNHFEVNVGVADVYINNTTDVATYSMPWFFVRFDASMWVAHHLLLRHGSFRQVIDLGTASMQPLGSYPVDVVNRPAVKVLNPSDPTTFVIDDRKVLYGNLAERAPYYGPPTIIAHCSTDASGVLIAGTGVGVSAVSLLSTGLVQIDFSRTLPNANYKVQVTLNQFDGFVKSVRSERAATGCAVRTVATDGSTLVTRGFDVSIEAGQ
jgi:hypothetical protein